MVLLHLIVITSRSGRWQFPVPSAKPGSREISLCGEMIEEQGEALESECVMAMFVLC